MSDEHSGERVLLYVLVGFGIAALAYLFFKDQFKNTTSTQSMNSMSETNIKISEIQKQTLELRNQMDFFNNNLKQLYGRNITKLNGVKADSVKALDSKEEDIERRLRFNMS